VRLTLPFAYTTSSIRLSRRSFDWRLAMPFRLPSRNPTRNGRGSTHFGSIIEWVMGGFIVALALAFGALMRRQSSFA
jgi:hypothetical protein